MSGSGTRRKENGLNSDIMPGRRNIYSGDRYGMLTVIREDEPNTTPCGTVQRKFLCKCDCGNEVVRTMGTLIHSKAKVLCCGCEGFDIGELNKKYPNGETEHYLYITWAGMKQRCYNKNSESYHRYGGRGITICDEWRYDYLAFKKWAESHGASKELSIDRIDNNGNYEPSNCRWVDDYVQANNKRTNRVIEYKGEKHTVMQWSRITSINESVIRSRLDKYGCSIGEALGFEGYDGSPDHIIEYNGERHNIREWSEITGVIEGTISSRLRYGYSDAQALGFEPYERKNPPKFITFNGETHNLTEWSRITGVDRHMIKKRLGRGCPVSQALGFEPYVRKKSSYVAPTKSVLEYDLDGNFIKEWDSAISAAKHYGASQTAIRYACNGVTKSSCNRIWKYK